MKVYFIIVFLLITNLVTNAQNQVLFEDPTREVTVSGRLVAQFMEGDTVYIFTLPEKSLLTGLYITAYGDPDSLWNYSNEVNFRLEQPIGTQLVNWNPEMGGIDYCVGCYNTHWLPSEKAIYIKTPTKIVAEYTGNNPEPHGAIFIIAKYIMLQ